MACDFDLIRQLLHVAHETAAPDDIGAGEWDNREFLLASGWKVVIFYDCGDLDYIDHFVTPAGEIIGLWGEELDSRVDDSGEDIFATLQNWRGLADTERLLDALSAPMQQGMA